MKTFNDLNFRPYGYETKVADKLYESKLSDEEFENTLAELSPAKNAVMHFPNGWGVSVVLGNGHWYSNGIDTYEVGIMYMGKLRMSNPTHYDSIIPHLTKEQVTDVMLRLQKNRQTTS